MPVAFVDVEVRNSAEFDRIFLFFVVPNEQEFISEGKFSPFAEFNGLQLKINLIRINLIKSEVVCRIVIEDTGFGKTTVVKVDFDVCGAATGDMAVCGDNPTFGIYNKTGGETCAFCFRLKDYLRGGFDVHHHRLIGGNLFCPVVLGIDIYDQY